MTTDRAPVRFAKLEGLGNDFMLVDARSGAPTPPLDPAILRRLADRRLGVGFDQFLLLLPSRDDAAFAVVIHNADGSPAEQCGNGMRALAAWLDAHDQLPEHGLVVATPAGPVHLDRAEPIDGQAAWSAELPGLQLLERGPGRREVRLGNPHRVLRVDVPPDAEALAAAFRAEPDAAGLNLGLACAVDRHRIALRVHERGAGPTPACGSGACAAAASMIASGEVDRPVRVDQPGGSVVVDWQPGESRVRLTGPARPIFEGWIAWPNPTPPN
ncbi:diaminopimelate epimerase [Wenzhouxiangella sp. XN79A]|uniref:diaminopimelate epimerase n=1 Tax=Wenzhouxiangella sp. XN79A TaxID=2724193 RepID=UPI00144AE475|nr:diaminopimelate epimerase [Wenzhouxiangella sp. XN79A]NKI35802.1 diaminopimelate epimerase [Wenzhouxiangella sp. XN79A]